MTHDDDPLDRYMDTFGERLEAAAAQRKATKSPRRRLRRAALIGGPVAALALTAVLLLLPGSTTPRHLDVLAEARAALAPQQDELTHLVVRQRLLTDDDNKSSYSRQVAPIVIEQWSATRPVRWRVGFALPPDSDQPPGTQLQMSYANGVQEQYTPKSNRLRRSHGLGKLAAPAASPLGTDPVATLRSLLSRGQLRDAGSAKVGERDVHRLVGTRSRTIHTKKGKQTYKSPVEYDVDPTTFSPVRARIGLPFPRTSGASPLFVVLDFTTFERLPLTPATERLLAIHPKPGVKVTETDRHRRGT